MAGTATPVAAAAPAPSAPAPSAPVSAPSPAPVSAPAPSALVTPEAAPQTPVSTPGVEPAAPPAAPYDPKTAPAPPKNTDYPNTTEGQSRFATEMNRWYAEHPEGEKPAAPAAEQTPEQKALAEAAPEAPKAPAAPEVAATPQQLAEMMGKNPAFKDFMEANPDVKGPVFQMARELAAAKPIAEMFPSVDDAKFAQEYSSAMVGLKTASMRLIDNPDNAGSFLETFDSQFQQVGADGNPVLDAQGKPVYDADREAVRGAIFNSEIQQHTSKITGELDALKVKLAGQYPSDFARTQDQERLDNLEYAQTALEVLESVRDGSFFESAPPAPAADATPEQKQWFEQETAKLKAQRDELDASKKGASKEERAAAAQKFQSTVRNDMGASVGAILGNTLQQILDSGVYIPQANLDEKWIDPETRQPTNTAYIAGKIFTQFEEKLKAPGSRTLMEIAQHELLPQNEQTREIRKNWYARKATEMIPDLLNAEVDLITSRVKLDQKTLAERDAKRREVASPEPQTGGNSLPGSASREQVLQAAEEAAKKDPGFATANPTEKQARILTQVHRMQKK